MTTTNSALWEAASAESAVPSGSQGLYLQTLRSTRIGIPPVPSAVEGSDYREPRGRSGGEERAKGEEKSNRNNPTFKNRRNPLAPKEKPVSNRNKNATSGLPHFRPWERHSPEWRLPATLLRGPARRRQSGDWRSREPENILDPNQAVDDDFGARQRQRARS